MSANDLAHQGSARRWFDDQRRALDNLRALAMCQTCQGEGIVIVPDGEGEMDCHEEQCRCWWGWLLSPAATSPLNPPSIDEEPF